MIEYAHLTGEPFRVFCLDNPVTCKFYDTIEKHYNICIDYKFLDAVEV